MKTTKTEWLDISLSAKEIKEIVGIHLTEKHGISVKSSDMHFNIETIYDGSMGDPGTDEVTGIRISTILNQSKKEI